MNVSRGKLISGGRLQVPADVRRELGLADGDVVQLRVVDGELRVRPMRAVLTRAQARLREYIPAGSDLANELIRDRRRSADSE